MKTFLDYLGNSVISNINILALKHFLFFWILLEIKLILIFYNNIIFFLITNNLIILNSIFYLLIVISNPRSANF